MSEAINQHLQTPARLAPAAAPGAAAAGRPDMARLDPYLRSLELARLRAGRDVERGAAAEDVSPIGWVS